MLKSIKQLKASRPDLVELFDSMNREQLLRQIWKECFDAINMEERVQTFMSYATNGMSYTTYTPDVIKQFIQDKHEKDIEEWCLMTLEDSHGDDDYILKEVKAQAKNA